MRIAQRKYYLSHKDKWLNYVRMGRKFIQGYKATHSCVDCGESDPVVLEFDHRDPKKKSFNIGENVGRSIRRLAVEIEKCDIRCANCHRRRTHKQRIGVHT